MAMIDAARLEKLAGTVHAYGTAGMRAEFGELCETIRGAWEAVEELRATLTLTQVAKSAWEDAANVEGRTHALLRREALRTQDHAKQLRHALGVMLANADRDHWSGRAAQWDRCQAVYDATKEVGDGDDDGD